MFGWSYCFKISASAKNFVFTTWDTFCLQDLTATGMFSGFRIPFMTSPKWPWPSLFGSSTMLSRHSSHLSFRTGLHKMAFDFFVTGTRLVTWWSRSSLTLGKPSSSKRTRPWRKNHQNQKQFSIIWRGNNFSQQKSRFGLVPKDEREDSGNEESRI